MKQRQFTAIAIALQVVGLTLLTGQLWGCSPHGLLGRTRLLRAALLDRDRPQPPADVVRIAAWTSTDGDFTGSGGGGRAVVPSPEDGSFELRLESDGTSSSPSNVPAFPPPDEILVIVKREACEQQFTIEINEDTVVDLDFPGGVIELKDPILAPPCGEDVSGE